MRLVVQQSVWVYSVYNSYSVSRTNDSNFRAEFVATGTNEDRTDKVLFIAIMDQTAVIDPLTDALVI